MKITCFLLAFIMYLLPIQSFADTPMPGIEMPDNIRNLLNRMEKTSQDGNVARIIQQTKVARLAMHSGDGEAVQSATAMALPLLIGTYSNSANSYSRDEFQNQIFEENPDGTMVDYYQEISYNQFQLVGQTYGWYTAPQTQSYYVGTQAGLTGGGARFALELVKAADATVDYSQFDSDNDGYVDVVMIAHTGPGAETQPSNLRDNIWSHRWNFYSAHYYYPSIMPQGIYTTNDAWPGHPGQFIKVNDYVIQPELKSQYDNGLIDIGVFCHEFGHALGLPDLYDTDYSSAGIGNWCLMSAGSYGADGAHPQSPAHMSAWCKEELGWISPTVVDEDRFSVEIPNIEEHYGAVYKLWKDGNPGEEYFLVENRQRVGFDKYIYSPGLLIWHIDRGVIAEKSNSNSVNGNEDHKGIDLEEADGRNDLDNYYNRGDAGDIFPGTSDNASFTATSNPSSKDYTNSTTGVAITNISLSGSIVIADLIIGVEGIESDGRMTVFNDGLEPLVVNNILADKTWLMASPASFTLAPGSNREVKLSIDWNKVSREEIAKLSFTSNDDAQPVLNATVTAVPAGGTSEDYVLTVSIDTVEVAAIGELASFEVSNSGSGTLNWSAVAEDGWLEITAGHGGEDYGVVQVTSFENNDNLPRTGSVTVSAVDNPAITKQVTFVQAGAEDDCAATWEATLLMQAGTTITSLQFGQGPNTTSQLDVGCGETELPPVPPSEIFDARFQIAGTQGSLSDYRSDGEDEPVWTLKLQPGINTSSIAFSWNKSLLPEGSFTLVDGFGGAVTNINMKTSSTYVLTNTNVTTLFIKYTAEVSENVAVVSGWNMISVPLNASDMSVSALFPNSGTASAYAFEDGFVPHDVLQMGTGYWLKSTVSTSYAIHGYQTAANNIEVKAGWNLIGPFAADVAVSSIASSPLDNIASDFFGFSNGYKAVSLLEAGKGYWVRVNQDGLLIFASASGKAISQSMRISEETHDYLQISDAAGTTTQLYFGSLSEVALCSELPPLPPAGVSDIRFGNNKNITAIDEKIQSVNLRSLVYPVQIELISEGMTVAIANAITGEPMGEISKEGNGFLLQSPIEKLSLAFRVANTAPDKFELAQNYPNPFNPETTIHFSIPKTERVQLTIYNELGQMQAELIDAELESGQYDIQFNGSQLSSGLYFYVLKTKTFQVVKKMILMK